MPPGPEETEARRGADPSEQGRARRLPLRVGVLIASLVVPRWVAEAIDELVAASFIDPVVVVVAAGGDAPQDQASRARVAARRGLFPAYRSIDHRLFRRSEDPLAPVDIAARIAGVRRVALPPGDTRGDALEPEDLDVVLDLAPVAEPRALAGRARHGVWSFDHGDAAGHDRDAQLFWEIYEGAQVSSTVLEAVSDPSEPAV